MKAREVPVEQAIGMTLAHDMTRIVPGEFKGRAFAKGHIITEADIPLLLDIGKRHIYVLEIGPDELHENDGALRMAHAVAGQGVSMSDVHEGKVILKAKADGVLWVDRDRLFQMNRIDDISIATRQPDSAVKAGMSVAGVRPIPLVVTKDKVERVEQIAAEAPRPVIDVVPYQPHRVALVTTGSEIKSGRITDKAGPALREKFNAFGVEVISQAFPGDDLPDIVAAIEAACADGATLVCVTGGMSVDPDDRSPAAIRHSAAEVITYGTPMLPGSMLMLAYRGETAIFGLPGAVIYDKVTSFDLLLPRVLAGLRWSKDDIARLGAGGWLND
ncbi:molybdopterin-binding protein [Alicyclobacillus cycloheptanicus]|uniref:Molybdopterin molybdenumtransferase n=1 Tax=Alicyclobacillus cycloheptanicus TaxID=1457 RepID=A0ABT9XK00_9BACL|nr:molybdopterin-binding protein [Alicyclobacillus cycloheptanicus]MDQ0190051.1 molybdenum cofactor synthesis domain-containing protein [Alicyclobacillus cycloheptanicus]WDM02034.1 molybdopterin-binding protein [Alicyclobacillus cycloheptanicus]